MSDTPTPAYDPKFESVLTIVIALVCGFVFDWLHFTWAVYFKINDPDGILGLMFLYFYLTPATMVLPLIGMAQLMRGSLLELWRTWGSPLDAGIADNQPWVRRSVDGSIGLIMAMTLLYWAYGVFSAGFGRNIYDQGIVSISMLFCVFYALSLLAMAVAEFTAARVRARFRFRTSASYSLAWLPVATACYTTYLFVYVAMLLVLPRTMLALILAPTGSDIAIAGFLMCLIAAYLTDLRLKARRAAR